MLEFEPGAMTLVANWLTQNLIAFVAGAVFGIVVSAVAVATALYKLRRDNVI